MFARINVSCNSNNKKSISSGNSDLTALMSCREIKATKERKLCDNRNALN